MKRRKLREVWNEALVPDRLLVKMLFYIVVLLVTKLMD